MGNRKSRNIDDTILEKPVVSEEPNIPEKIIEDVINVGDRVKIKSDVSNDMLGRRIHNGIKNYNYTVKVARPDNYLIIECLTYIFTLHKDEVEKI